MRLQLCIFVFAASAWDRQVKEGRMNFRGYLVPLCLLPNRLKGFAVLDSKISQVWACVGVDVCLYGRRRCCTWCHWVYLQDCDVHSKCWHTGSHTHALPTVSPTGTTAATTCLNRETHPHKHTTMVTLGTLKHIMHTCPYQQHKGPLTHTVIHTPTDKHFGTNMNTSYLTVFLLYLGNVLRQRELVKLSMRIVPDLCFVSCLRKHKYATKTGDSRKQKIIDLFRIYSEDFLNLC